MSRDGQHVCCVLRGKAQSTPEQSRQHPGRGATDTVHKRKGTVMAQRRVQGRRHLAYMPYLTHLINPSQPCSHLSSEGWSPHHFVSNPAHVLPPLHTRKRRRRRQQRHQPHPQSLMRASKQFTTSCQSIFKPPSCSYRTFLVRHPASTCSHPRTFYYGHRWLWGVLCHHHCKRSF